MRRLEDCVHDRNGNWQNAECVDMKDRLLALEDERGSGRVSLAQFCNGRYSARWWLSEFDDYLQQLGASDESSQSRPTHRRSR